MYKTALKNLAEDFVMERPDIFEFNDYRSFMQSMNLYYKLVKKISMARLTKDAGFSSPAYLEWIQSGKRSLTEAKLSRLSRIYRLSPAEDEFFHILRRFALETSSETKSELQNQLLSLRQQNKVRQIDQDFTELYSNWYINAVFVFVGMKPQATDQVIEEELSLESLEVQKALAVLKRLELLEKSNGLWVKKSKTLETSVHMGEAVKEYHRQMLDRAKLSIDNCPENERLNLSLTLSMSEAEFESFRSYAWKFLQNTNRQTGQSEKRTYQINLQGFPLSCSSKLKN